MIRDKKLRWKTDLIDLKKDNLDEKLKEYIDDLKRELINRGLGNFTITTELQIMNDKEAQVYLELKMRETK
jgi:hypothetical protein